MSKKYGGGISGWLLPGVGDESFTPQAEVLVPTKCYTGSNPLVTRFSVVVWVDVCHDGLHDLGLGKHYLNNLISTSVSIVILQPKLSENEGGEGQY